MISMLIGLKVSSLVLKCVFCRRELTGKLVPPHETESLSFWNAKMYRAERVDGKNDAIHLVMFSPKVMVIRIWKMTHFMYFHPKNQSQFGQDI